MPTPFRKAPFPAKQPLFSRWLRWPTGCSTGTALESRPSSLRAVACGSLLANLAALNRKQVLLAGALLLVSLVPAIEEFNVASLTFMLLALGIGLLLTTNRDRHGLGERAAALCDLYLIGAFRFFRDAVGALNLPALKTGFVVWFVPIVLSGIF